MQAHTHALNVVVAAAQPHFSTHQHHYTTQHQKSGTVLPSGATASRLQQHPLYSQTLNSPTMSLFHHFMNHSMSSPKCTLSILRLNKLTMLEPSTISTSLSLFCVFPLIFFNSLTYYNPHKQTQPFFELTNTSTLILAWPSILCLSRKTYGKKDV